jgi:hypothetical protein
MSQHAWIALPRHSRSASNSPAFLGISGKCKSIISFSFFYNYILNRVQIRGIWRPIQHYNTRISKQIPDFMGNMDKGIVLYEYITWIIQFLKYRPNFCIQNLHITIGGIPIFLGIKISVHEIALGAPIIPEVPPDYYPYIFPACVGLDILRVLFRVGSTEALGPLFP